MQYLNFLLSNHENIEGEITPCYIKEIEHFEELHNLKLPKAYKEYLLIMGKKPGDLFSGSDVEFSILHELQAEGNEILERSIGKRLNPEDFVIFIHLNYSLYFLSLNAGDDPPVYFFSEPEDSPNIKLKHNSFSDYMFYTLDNYLKLNLYLKKLGPAPGEWDIEPIIKR